MGLFSFFAPTAPEVLREQSRQIFSLVFSVGSLTLSCDSCNSVDVFEGSSGQAIEDLPRSPVLKCTVCFVLALTHGLACCPHLLLVGPF